MEVKCPNCQKTFTANVEQEALLDGAINRGQRLVIIECPQCYKDVPIDPANLMSGEPQKDQDTKTNVKENIECPICHEGVIAYVENGDENFWGCGECGNVWFSKEALEKEIASKAN